MDNKNTEITDEYIYDGILQSGGDIDDLIFSAMPDASLTSER